MDSMLRFVLMLVVVGLVGVEAETRFRLCYVNKAKGQVSRTMEQCRKVVNNFNRFGSLLDCVPATDTMECISKLIRNDADVMVLEEVSDFYLVDKYYPDKIVVTTQMQKNSHKAKQRPFKEEVVAVVSKKAQIRSLHDLRGKMACLTRHNQVADNSGSSHFDSAIRVIVDTLRSRGILDKKCDMEATEVERDLAALSEFFGPSCDSGDWTFDPEFTSHLKRKYRNLCGICRKPKDCGRSDSYGGIYGAVSCLEEYGQVAWTTLSALRGRYNNGQSGYALLQYDFLCPDGTTQPFSTTEFNHTSCLWAGLPWPAFVSRASLGSKLLRELQSQLDDTLSNRAAMGDLYYAIDQVMGGSVSSGAVVTLDKVQTMREYMEKAVYSPRRMERGSSCGMTEERMRLCVTGGNATMSKCRDLRMAAVSRRIQPEIVCVQGSTSAECGDMVIRGEADVMSVDGGILEERDVKYDQLLPILAEGTPGQASEDFDYAIYAIVRSDSRIKRVSDLRGKRACIASYAGKDLGWYFPVHVLKNKGFVTDNCNYETALGEVFSQMCVFGSQLPDWGNPNKDCSLCKTGNASECPSNRLWDGIWVERDVYQCLHSGRGDVAFVTRSPKQMHPFDFPGENPIHNFEASNLRYLCPDHDYLRYFMSNATGCEWGIKPTLKIVTSRERRPYQVENYRIALYEAGIVFGSQNSPLRLFGPYHHRHDVLFKDTTSKLTYLPSNVTSLRTSNRQRIPYAEMLGALETCSGTVCFSFMVHELKYLTVFVGLLYLYV